MDIVTPDYSVYVKAKKSAENIPVIKEKFNEISSRMGVPKYFLEKTENITAVFNNDKWGYMVANGKYPDLFIRDRLEKSEEWEEGSCQKLKYYFSNDAKTILIFLKNSIIVSNFKEGSADSCAKKIMDILTANAIAFHAPVENTVFQVNSRNPGDVFTQFVSENVNLDTIQKINFNIILDPKMKKSGGVNITFSVEDENKAVLFNSVMRLFISDYVVKKKITDVKTLRENNSIFHSGDHVYVNISDIPLEKLNMFITDFLFAEETRVEGKL